MRKRKAIVASILVLPLVFAGAACSSTDNEPMGPDAVGEGDQTQPTTADGNESEPPAEEDASQLEDADAVSDAAADIVNDPEVNWDRAVGNMRIRFQSSGQEKQDRKITNELLQVAARAEFAPQTVSIVGDTSDGVWNYTFNWSEVIHVGHGSVADSEVWEESAHETDEVH